MVFFNLNIVEIDNFLDNIYFRFQLFELKIDMHDHINIEIVSMFVLLARMVETRHRYCPCRKRAEKVRQNHVMSMSMSQPLTLSQVVLG